MQIRALKTFNSKAHGLVRGGVVITVDDAYASKLIRSNLAESHAPENADQPGPAQNKALSGPDKRSGKGSSDDNADSSRGSSSDDETSSQRRRASGETENSSEDPPEDGPGRRSSSRRQGRRSPKLK